eukprot:GHUV01031016.1.p1 GENE.GHUV01031016.1~~GHUV01031016.1.p1  ORF type:complete len:251 (+),score=50.72 GHUV01031016.1:130-882(+)
MYGAASGTQCLCLACLVTQRRRGGSSTMGDQGLRAEYRSKDLRSVMSRRSSGICATYLSRWYPCLQSLTLAKAITVMIRDASSLEDLEDVISDWGSSFDHINVSAAFSKAAKLAGSRPASAQVLVLGLTRLWAAVQSNAGTWELANVLWASSKLRCRDKQLWGTTLEAFLQQRKTATCQELSNVAYALAVMANSNRGSVPGLTSTDVSEAITLMAEQVYLKATHPLLEGARSQELRNFLWACVKLRINPG